MRKFFGGVHPKYYKDLTSSKATKIASLPKEVAIPVSQHTGEPCKPTVKVGNRVKVGTRIAQSDRYVSSPIHASVSGIVKKIEDYPHPLHGRSLAVVIESDGRNELEPSIGQPREVEGLAPDEIRQIIRDAGIVGLGGAAFPTHVKLTPPKDKPIDSFILNGAECEPYLTCDHRLMLERPEQIIEGAKIIMSTIGVSNCYIGIEANKSDAIQVMKRALERTRETVKGDRTLKMVMLPVKYPQGAEKQLIKAILNREVPSFGLPFDVGVVVQNVGTALAVYEAVGFGKPLYERVVTVTGSCVKSPQNLRVRIGTPFNHLIGECGGLVKDPAKVIMGGPMMGLAQYTLSAPVIKGTSGVVIMGSEEVDLAKEGSCIRCARCLEYCPMQLAPTEIRKFVEARRWDRLAEYHVDDCIECGCCDYVCPAKLPLVHLIKVGKFELKKLKGAGSLTDGG